jgi:hypothetical protein
MIRRLRVGDLQKVFRWRYGYTLPDDDAGREDLRELLLPVSLGCEAGRKMQNAIEIWAPWMPAAEAGHLIDDINRTPAYLRKPKARELGHRQNITNQMREALGLRTIAPCDMTPAQLMQWRKAKKRASAERWRRKAGKKPRQAYLANALSRTKPWKMEGISRSTWYRRRRETSPYPIKLLTSGHTPVSPTTLRRCNNSMRHGQQHDRKAHQGKKGQKGHGRRP